MHSHYVEEQRHQNAEYIIQHSHDTEPAANVDGFVQDLDQ